MTKAMTTSAATKLDPATQRSLGVSLFNDVWTFLDLDTRTDEQVIEMIHAAHASAYHWMQVGEPVNRVRSEWQCSRVYAVAGRAEPALWHARLALAICEQHGIADFDLGFTYEALARAYALAGQPDEATRYLEQARKASADIAADHDRELLLADLETIEVGGAGAG